MEKLKVEPVDSIIDENKKFFYADEQMLNILINNDFQDYLDYIKNKQFGKTPADEIKELKQKLIEKELELEELKELKKRQNYKNEMLSSMMLNINRLEETIKKFKN